MPVAVIGAFDGTPDERLYRLAVLDPRTGAILSEHPLAKGGKTFFPGFSDVYGLAQVLAADVDGDGVDEVFVTYLHQPFWPSYTVLFDPVTGASRVVFAGTGHHVPVGVEDVDKDGLKELFLVGPNNRFGFLTGIAAVHVASAGPGLWAPPPASTPDTLHGPSSFASLAWYALGPLSGTWGGDRGRLFQAASRRIVFSSEGGSLTVFGFDGFRPNVASELGPRERQEARSQVYQLLRDAARSEAAQDHTAEINFLAKASLRVGSIGDDGLARWVLRRQGVAVARTGQEEAAERILKPLLANRSLEAEILLEVARRLNEAGSIARAVAWYERSMAAPKDPQAGRGTWECALEGMLALGELRRWKDAAAWVERYERADSGEPRDAAPSAYMAGYLQWRSGRKVDSVPPLAHDHVDLFRYWGLEFRLARGERPAVVREALAAEISHVSSEKALFDALGGWLANLQGEIEPAMALSRKAFDEAVARQDQDFVLRAHLGLIAERYEEIARRAGRIEETKRARLERDQVRQRLAGQ